MSIQVLLLEDVDSLGRTGQVHKVAPGYARNYLLPKGYAVKADKATLRKQERLLAERAKKAQEDRADAEKLSSQLHGLILTVKVKVDPHGHMYGSVSINDLHKLFEQEGYIFEKRYIQLPHAIKQTGSHAIVLHFKEEVSCECRLQIIAEDEIIA